MAKASRPKPRRAERSTMWLSVAATLAALVVAAAARMLASRQAKLRLIANGGSGAAALIIDPATWHTQAHNHYPHATRIGFWNESGFEVAWSDVQGQGSELTTPSSSPLYAVLDNFPFVWPADTQVTVDVGAEDGEAADSAHRRIVQLHTVSDSPRVLVADGVLSEAECGALREAAGSALEDSFTLAGGRRVDISDASTSPRADRPGRRRGWKSQVAPRRE